MKWPFTISRLMRRRWLWLLLATFSLMIGAVAEQRFPPPEFESGHQLPLTKVPAAREWLLQYLDVIVLAAALAISSWLVHKKRSRKGIVALSIFSVFYFGFWRKGCVCSIGSLQNVALALGDPGYSLPVGVMAFFALPLLVALFGGRAFCAGVCPHGALQDLVLVKPLKVPAWLEQGLGILPFVYLGAAVLFAVTGSAFIICQYDPFIPVFRMSGRTLMVLAGVVLLVLGMFVGRPYCRFLCPYGALLKLSGLLSKWRVRVTPNTCTQCRLCEDSCPFGAMREPQTVRLDPKQRIIERARLARLLILLPLLLAAGGLLGWGFSRAASRVHPTVQLAEVFLRGKDKPIRTGPLAPDDFALEKAQQNPAVVLNDAARITRHFALGGSLFGAWVGLVLGAKLISLSVRGRRTDYEPDRGACLACARCFEYCPNELARRGVAISPPCALPSPTITSMPLAQPPST